MNKADKIFRYATEGMSDEEIDQILRSAGFDPVQIARRFEEIADAALAKALAEVTDAPQPQ